MHSRGCVIVLSFLRFIGYPVCACTGLCDCFVFPEVYWLPCVRMHSRGCVIVLSLLRFIGYPVCVCTVGVMVM